MHSHVMFHLIFLANILVWQHILSLANALLRQVKTINVSIMLFWFESLYTISINQTIDYDLKYKWEQRYVGNG